MQNVFLTYPFQKLLKKTFGESARPLLGTGRIKVYSFSGTDTEDMSDFIKPLISRKPNEIIIHCGTNDLCSIKTNEEIVDNILKLRLVIVSYGIRCTVSNIVKLEDG